MLLVLMVPLTARAQQPFSTDDADVTPKRGIHFEAFNEFDWLQDSQAPHLRQNTTNMRMNIGLTGRLEFNLDFPLIAIVNDSTAPIRRPFGLGDTNIGLKYNVRPERDTSAVPAVSFATYVETPTGDTNSDLGSGLIDVWFYGILQKTLTPVLMVRTNFGYVFNGNTATGVVGIQTTRRHIATMGASVVRTIKST